MSFRTYHTHVSKPIRVGLACAALVGVWFAGIQPGYHALQPTFARLKTGWEYDRCNRIGNRLYSEHDYDGAKQQYLRMIELRPEKDSGYLLCGWADYATRRYQDGVDDNTKALLHAKDIESRAVHYYNRGLNFMALKDWTAAKNDFQMSLLYRSGDADAREHLAFACALRATDEAKQSEYAQAVADMKTALQYKTNGVWWGSLGWYQYEAGQERDALQSSRHALELDSTQTFVHFNLGLFYATQGQGDAMRREYKTALAHPTDQDLNGATDDVRTALRTHPKSALLQEALELLANAQAVKSIPNRYRAGGGATR